MSAKLKEDKMLKLKTFLLAISLIMPLSCIAEEIIIPPKTEIVKSKAQKTEDAEIQNLSQYFEYLPNAVHKNWTPYKANTDYEITVQFSVKKNGEITEPEIVKSTNEKANSSVINAVKSGSPYKPLPAKYPSDSVRAQVELKYLKN